MIYRLVVGSLFLKIPFLETNRCLKVIQRHGIQLTYDQLAAHYLAGGRIASWVGGLVYAQEHGIKLDRDNAAARDLIAVHGSKITLVEHLKILEAAGFRDAFKAPIDSLKG